MNNYKLEGNHLYELRTHVMGDSWIHVANVPFRIKSLKNALEWYNELGDNDEY